MVKNRMYNGAGNKNRRGGQTMKKLKLAVIGQGRSGRDIHGRFYRSQ